jgi:hypothetical protein
MRLDAPETFRTPTLLFLPKESDDDVNYLVNQYEIFGALELQEKQLLATAQTATSKLLLMYEIEEFQVCKRRQKATKQNTPCKQATMYSFLV